MASLTTPLSELLGKEKEINDPASQYGQMPSEQHRQVLQQQQMMQMQQMQQERELNRPVTNELPSGSSQGVSAPVKANIGKEFFGIKQSDYKTFILVFAVLLIFTSSVFYSGLRPYIPGIVGSDGRTTIIGSFMAAIVGTLVFILVKGLGKF